MTKTLDSTSPAQRRAEVTRQTREWMAGLEDSTPEWVRQAAALLNALGCEVALHEAARGRAAREVLDALRPLTAPHMADYDTLSRIVDAQARQAEARAESAGDAVVDRRLKTRVNGGGVATGIAPPAVEGFQPRLVT